MIVAKLSAKTVELFDFLRNRLKLVIRFCYLVLALLVLWDALILDKSYVHIAAEKLPGFWSLFGLISCFVLVFFSKWYGHLGITTDEDYYER